MAIVWRLSTIQFEQKTLFVGTILQNQPFHPEKKHWDFWNFLKVMYSYFCPSYRNQSILIHTPEAIFKTQTNYKGGFRFVSNQLISGQIRITDAKNNPIQIIQNYPICFQNTASDFDVISDIDDTIIKSYTAHFIKRIGTILFKTPKRRRVISFTQQILNKSKKQHARVFYLSKSESNLFFILTNFIEYHDLPRGPLLLTPYLKFRQLFRPKKGKNYKINYLKFIFENSKGKQFILLGDDSQRDVEIYTEIARSYPDQIKQIYIRQTKKKPSLRQVSQIRKMRNIVSSQVIYFGKNDVPKHLIL